MATLKGFIRSYSSTVKKIERDQQRRAREAAKFYKQQAKQQEFANAQEAVEQYERYIDLIKSIHKECTDSVDWSRIKNEPAPVKPFLNNNNEEVARANFNIYTPSFIDKLFGLSKKKTERFEEAIENAIVQDKTEYEESLSDYNQELTNWTRFQSIANGVLERNPTFYKEVLEVFNPFAEIIEFGSKLNITFQEDSVIVDLNVKGNEIIPNYILSKTASGKLSKKNMPISKFNELYQDYVCSCILRIAREILAYLPIQYVIINAKGELLNSATGHLEDQTIVSVQIPPSTLDRLNFETIDPSDSMKNFIHNMKFSKTNGFTQVNLISQG